MNKVVDYKNENSTAHISVTIKQENVMRRYSELMQEYLKDAQMPGFRKGHVPKDLFEKKYAQAIEGETANKLVEESLEDALKDLEREVVRVRSPKVIAADTLDKNKDFQFTLEVEVMPFINVKGYEKTTAPKYEISITDTDIENELKRLQEQNAFVVNKDSEAQEHDILDVNYVEIDTNEQEIVGTARQNFTFTLGEGKNLYDWDKDLLGVKSGETRTVVKSFPEDHANADLAGKNLTLKVTVNSVKGKNLPDLDDEFAQDVNEKFNTLADLKADIRSKFEENSVDVALMRRCDELLDGIVKKYPFTVPEGLILSDIEMRFSQLARQMNISEDQLVQMIGGNANNLIEQWRPESESSVVKKLVLEHLGQLEKVSVSESEFSEQAEKVAKQYRSTVEELTKQVGDGNFKSYIEEQAKTQKVLSLLSDKCQVSEVLKLSLEEFNKLEPSH